MHELSGPKGQNVMWHTDLHLIPANLSEERNCVLTRRAKGPHYSHIGGETGMKTLVGNEASPAC